MQLEGQGLWDVGDDGSRGQLGFMTARTVYAASPEEAVGKVVQAVSLELVRKFGSDAVADVTMMAKDIYRISWYRWWNLNLALILIPGDAEP
ncbi:MAG: hypothetical protein JNK60_03320 [Acidobacteria bacterium]|nr:hypothetical protein [Acidobacteriota bacterium]